MTAVPGFETRRWHVRSAACTDKGPVRTTNEDAFFRDDALGLYVVADGLGGHAAGEVASRLAIEAFTGFISQSHADEELTWPFGQDPTLTLAQNRLITAARLAHHRVNRAAAVDQDNLAGMATTLVAVVVDGPRISFCHAGDSRLYLLESGADRVLRLTDDDVVTINGAHRPRTALTNAIGIGQFAGVHVGHYEATGDVTLLLSTDGLHGVVDEATLLAILQGEDLDQVARALVQAALDARTRDNVTAVVVRLEGSPS